MPYATVEELRQYLHQVSAGQETDAVLEEILERATDIVDLELGFSFAAIEEYAEATARDVQSGNGGRVLFLPAYQTGSLETVSLVTGRGTADESTIAVTDYIEESRWRLYRYLGWRPRSWYRVTAVWGVGEAPDAIVEVTIEVAVNIWRGRQSGTFAASVGAEGGGVVQYTRALTWAQRSIIERVRAQYPRESYA